jgi:acyl-CoA thioester hydrolase
MPTFHDLEIRVRYQETDAQGRVHHANYANYFELGRTELLRTSGRSYREIEEQGLLLVVTELSCRYHKGAVYDDLLRLRTTTGEVKGARIEHLYHLYHGEELLVEGRTVIACIDRSGRPRRVPDWLAPIR